MKHYSM